jgi:adenylate cyclase
MHTVFEKLLDWQRETSAAGTLPVHDIVHRYCRFMVHNGVSVCRSTLALSTLHPQIQALRYVWFDDLRDPGRFPSPALFVRHVHHVEGCTIDEAQMSHGAKNTQPFRQSPFWRLIEEALPKLEFRLQRGGRHAYPILDDLAEAGATHYVLYPLDAIDGQISLVSREPAGFSDKDLALIERSLSPLGLLLDNAIKDLVLRTVLDCYVGTSPGLQVREGNIRPGAMLDMHGAIWFSDIRGYTAASRQFPPDEFIQRLNAYYEVLVSIIYAHGGEVLKFIGDAVLAIFADDNPDDDREACRSAYAAALAANRALLERRIAFDHGIGLHVGHFRFGNIGSLRRMDFTVIGNEVNVAARIEAQCGLRGERVLMSAAFLAQCAVPAREVVVTRLKGIEGEYALFAPDEAQSA